LWKWTGNNVADSTRGRELVSGVILAFFQRDWEKQRDNSQYPAPTRNLDPGIPEIYELCPRSVMILELFQAVYTLIMRPGLPEMSWS
jgi:hypothetical protein